jgi:hypothetical protein
MHASIPALLNFFKYDHLPEDLQTISRVFHDLAYFLVEELGEKTDGNLATGPQLNRALQKLLESKDAAVRAALEIKVDDAPRNIE